MDANISTVIQHILIPRLGRFPANAEGSDSFDNSTVEALFREQGYKVQQRTCFKKFIRGPILRNQKLVPTLQIKTLPGAFLFRDGLE